jgi:adenylylsulfate kinase
MKAESDQPPPADNLTWHAHKVTRADREALHGHRGATLWFTGLSGSGKSTLANEVAHALHQRGVSTYVLDGDNVRQGLNRGLGFTEDDRRENIRRIAEVAKLFSDAGIVNLTAFISPYRSERALARELQPGAFVEIHVKADVATCAARDPKGLYKRALAGEIAHFTGVSPDAPYEEPESPEIVADTASMDLATCTAHVIARLQELGIIPATAQ